MNNLVDAGRFQEAYDLGNAQLEEWEGDPGFDFFYGLAALEVGEANAAVFALERTVAQRPMFSCACGRDWNWLGPTLSPTT